MNLSAAGTNGHKWLGLIASSGFVACLIFLSEEGGMGGMSRDDKDILIQTRASFRLGQGRA